MAKATSVDAIDKGHKAAYARTKQPRVTGELITTDELRIALAKPKKRAKYRNVRVKVDGFAFDSKAEACHFQNLRILERAGRIASLRVHPIYPIFISGTKVCDVEMDFAFVDHDAGGVETAVDVKGRDNPMSKLKRKMFHAAYPELTLQIVQVR